MRAFMYANVATFTLFISKYKNCTNSLITLVFLGLVFDESDKFKNLNFKNIFSEITYLFLLQKVTAGAMNCVGYSNLKFCIVSYLRKLSRKAYD